MKMLWCELFTEITVLKYEVLTVMMSDSGCLLSSWVSVVSEYFGGGSEGASYGGGSTAVCSSLSATSNKF